MLDAKETAVREVAVSLEGMLSGEIGKLRNDFADIEDRAARTAVRGITQAAGVPLYATDRLPLPRTPLQVPPSPAADVQPAGRPAGTAVQSSVHVHVHVDHLPAGMEATLASQLRNQTPSSTPIAPRPQSRHSESHSVGHGSGNLAQALARPAPLEVNSSSEAADGTIWAPANDQVQEMAGVLAQPHRSAREPPPSTSSSSRALDEDIDGSRPSAAVDDKSREPAHRSPQLQGSAMGALAGTMAGGVQKARPA